MDDKGKKDRGKRGQQKKAQLNLKEKRRHPQHQRLLLAALCLPRLGIICPIDPLFGL
ncbi:hypothetical protein ACFLRM_05650 [Acidobacteriota bacterium]